MLLLDNPIAAGVAGFCIGMLIAAIVCLKMLHEVVEPFHDEPASLSFDDLLTYEYCNIGMNNWKSCTYHEYCGYFSRSGYEVRVKDEMSIPPPPPSKGCTCNSEQGELCSNCFNPRLP